MTRLMIHLFDGFRVTVNGRAVPADAWSQRKPAALLKLLALAPGHRLRREQVMDLLWPDLDPAAAAANLRKALHSARRTLDAEQGSDLVQSVGDLLCLPAEDVHVDVDDYWQLVTSARRTRDPGAYARAIDRYGDGLVPEDRYEDWAAAPREEIQTDWLDAIEEYAGLLEARGDLNGAARAVARRVALDPLREADHVWLMRLYSLAGRREEARRQYFRLRDLLRDELGVAPRPETVRQFQEINTEPAADPRLTTDLWERVADLRVQSGDSFGAVAAYQQALSSAAADASTGRIHRKCAAAWLMQHHPDDAEPHLAAAERLADSAAERGRLACLRANQAWERGDLVTAHGLAEQAHESACADGDPDDVAAALEALAFVAHMGGTWRPGLQAQMETLAGAALGTRISRFCDFNHCLGQYHLYGDVFASDVEDYARDPGPGRAGRRDPSAGVRLVPARRIPAAARAVGRSSRLSGAQLRAVRTNGQSVGGAAVVASGRTRGLHR